MVQNKNKRPHCTKVGNGPLKYALPLINGDPQISDHSPSTVFFFENPVNTGNQDRITIIVDSSQLCMRSMCVSVKILTARTVEKQTRYEWPKVRSANSNLSTFCMLFSSRIIRQTRAVRAQSF